MLGDSAIRLSWGRSAVAARPASSQLRSFNPIGYAPGGAFGALQPTAAAAYAAPFAYGLGQPAGMPSSIYTGMPQVRASAFLLVVLICQMEKGQQRKLARSLVLHVRLQQVVTEIVS